MLSKKQNFGHCEDSAPPLGELSAKLTERACDVAIRNSLRGGASRTPPPTMVLTKNIGHCEKAKG